MDDWIGALLSLLTVLAPLLLAWWLIGRGARERQTPGAGRRRRRTRGTHDAPGRGARGRPAAAAAAPRKAGR
ncbi:hypothetical protein [Piscinibacter koreensis]|uniref:Uncharacterized protein n=1 Tax=Piscinibacter koreensis TaxID=2742824 RepID=A0A7Y6NS04_9BURK|nr:hypothetical protein [Schlegelella koreensis]NUZ08258.1 hypothetical protein [Schlegelella koreensis]